MMENPAFIGGKKNCRGEKKFLEDICRPMHYHLLPRLVIINSYRKPVLSQLTFYLKQELGALSRPLGPRPGNPLIMNAF